MKCSKCLYENDLYKQYAYFDPDEPQLVKAVLCHHCDRAFDIMGFLLKEFLKEDFGSFPIHEVSKSMINARRNRALGNSPWEKSNGDNKGQDCEV